MALEPAPTDTLTAEAAAGAPADDLDELDDIEFELEEIENKIAPLALA